MALPRLPAGGAGLVLALLALAPGAAPQGGRAALLEPRQAIVAAHATTATATSPDASWRTELAWLLPGDGDPAVAPDGRHLAFSSARTGNREIYVADTLTGDVQRVTSSRRLDDRRPSWSPDGRLIAWEARRSAAGDLFVMRADGSHKRRLAGGASDEADPAWSPDGTRVAFASNRDGEYDLWVAPRSGGEPELLLDVRGGARAPAWSPNGSRIAYSAAEAGRTQHLGGRPEQPRAPPGHRLRRSRPAPRLVARRHQAGLHTRNARPFAHLGGRREHGPGAATRRQRRRPRPGLGDGDAVPRTWPRAAPAGSRPAGAVGARRHRQGGRLPARVHVGRREPRQRTATNSRLAPARPADHAGRPARRAARRRNLAGPGRGNAALRGAPAAPALALPGVRDL